MSSDSNIEVPQYFVAQWWQKKGYNPIAMKARGEKLNSYYWRMLWAVVVLILFVSIPLSVYAAWKHLDGMSILTALGTVFVIFVVGVWAVVLQEKGKACAEKARDFEYRLNSLAGCLGLEEDQMFELAQSGNLAPLAVARLQAMAKYIVAVQAIPGSESESTIAMLRRSMENHFNQFKEWALVPPDCRIGDYFPKS